MATIPVTSPKGWAITVGTASIQALPGAKSRTRIIFHNPNATALIAVCPEANGSNANPLPAVINGAGSFTILPGAMLDISRDKGEVLDAAFNIIANGGGASATIWEFF